MAAGGSHWICGIFYIRTLFPNGKTHDHICAWSVASDDAKYTSSYSALSYPDIWPRALQFLNKYTNQSITKWWIVLPQSYDVPYGSRTNKWFSNEASNWTAVTQAEMKGIRLVFKYLAIKPQKERNTVTQRMISNKINLIFLKHVRVMLVLMVHFVWVFILIYK